MVAASYIRGSTKYSVEPITTYEMIDHDIGMVLELIEGTPLDKYRHNMEVSVDQRLAYAVFKGTERVGFVYNRVEGNKYYGSSIYVWKDLVAMMVAMKTMFEIAPYKKITFVPHKDNLKYFKSMIAGDKIRAYHSGKTTVTIVGDKLMAEGPRLFEYLGIEVIV